MRHVGAGRPRSGPRARRTLGPVVRDLLTPRMLALHLLGAFAVAAACWLGWWQLQSWQAERELAAQDLAEAPAIPLDDALGADEVFANDQVGRPVTVAGAWLPEGGFEVADRDLDGRTGRWVVTPVAVCPAGDCDGASAIPVVRGWLAPGEQPPAAPRGEVELTGWLQPGEGTGLADPDPTDRVIPEMRIANALQLVDRDLYGGYVIARDLPVPGLAPVTPDSLPEPAGSTSLRNLLYAAEWAAFAVFAGFLWWRFGRDELDRTRRARDDGEPSVDPGGVRSTPTPGIPSSP
jgi:surfeit locus 1 family protein